MKGPKNDKVGLDRLLKLSVLGSVIIVVVYSVYYYANAYRYSRSNILLLEQSTGTRVESRENRTVVRDENILFSHNLHAALFQPADEWKPMGRQPVFSLNTKTTIALSGSIGHGYYDLFSAALNQKFQAIPPFQKSELEDGVSVRSVQFEHFAFPYHAMIAWRDRSLTYRYFQFSCDSLGPALQTYQNGFAWTSNGPKGGYIMVYNCAIGDTVEIGKSNFKAAQAYGHVKMPVLDFDAIYSDRGLLSSYFHHEKDSLPVVEAVGELKILVGPSLKQRDAYTLTTNPLTTLTITPPYVVSLHNSPSEAPYLTCVVANDQLLLK
ncbi:MAG: hypothetical protein HYZ16_10920 [Bacteroidetes bacterium]|nr:hypothetical protein [Bacteroidota bacterium]